MRKKVYLILLLVSLLALGVGAASPALPAAAQAGQNQTSTCGGASTFLVGRLAGLPRIRGLIRETCDFRVRLNEIDEDVSRFDRFFIESAIAGNMLEIQTLEYTLERTENQEYRGLLQMMIAMHTSDLEMALDVAEKIGADTTPNLMNARVYPQTPAYDLGMRRINLVARYLDPLMSSPDENTPTPISTTVTSIPTDTGTVLPPVTPTSSGTVLPPVTPTSSGTATFVPVPTGTGTFTPTPAVTETGTTITPGTVTTSPDTPTAVGTETEMATATPPPDTNTPDATDTTTAVPTETSTAIPTVIPPTRPDFEMLSMHILEDEHAMSIETALAAQRLAENREIRAFAKHAADVAKLHVLLLDDLQYRLAFNVTLPEPRFHEDYQSPRRLEPAANEAME
ncbi:MAG TPA: hypothetical protein VFY83_14210 [Anaerolineales bacterium]|nr:hypothetical protein [Anaerolineales bacterium]